MDSNVGRDDDEMISRHIHIHDVLLLFGLEIMRGFKDKDKDDID